MSFEQIENFSAYSHSHSQVKVSMEDSDMVEHFFFIVNL